jgi:CelD/BcsL family acetyltransferase involved in cellulose biosynthesis
MRKYLRQQDRKLGRERNVAYRIVAPEDPLEPALDDLLRLHEMRWPEGSRYADEFPFHREFAEHAHARGWLRLWFLEVDGEPVAAWHCFNYHGTQTYYQSGRDPAWDKSSVGLLLLCHAVAEAFRQGTYDHRFGRGAEWYKYRLARDDAGLETIGLAATFRGRAALAAAPSFRRFRPSALVDWFHGSAGG